QYAEIGQLVAQLAGRLGVTAGTAPAVPLSPLEPAPVAAAAAAPAEKPASEEAVSGPTVNAPLNGTFYRSAGPGKPELAKEGDAVKGGDAICIVEAMKLFNQIKADKDLTVVKFLVKHGDAVTKGQPLAVVKYA
ncbi:MAG: acetyl-CoA carboxylase biotin carboxyl carrier protein, partial [Kiritimatiellae bacterium]|nr:acetyl-CoA carboxylase biotin carboxyl carrier protein [Kiritimatiellia bacterium]